MQIFHIKTNQHGEELTQHGSADFPCVSYDELFSQFVGQEVPWHWHHEVEIVLVVAGATWVETPHHGQWVNEGEVLFINSDTLHKMSLKTQPDCRILNTLFNPLLLAGMTYGPLYQQAVAPIVQNRGLECFKLSAASEWQHHAITTLRTALEYWQEGFSDKEWKLTLALVTFWDTFKERLPPVNSPSPTRLKQQSRLQKLLDTLHKDFSSPITMADLCQQAGVSEAEGYRLFKRLLGTTPNRYLTEFRLRHAAAALTQTDTPVAQVAEQAGFSCPAYFAKQFKQHFGKTPRQHRQGSQGSEQS